VAGEEDLIPRGVHLALTCDRDAVDLAVATVVDMVVLDVTCILPRPRPTEPTALPGRPAGQVRPATLHDVERTAALELDGAALLLRMFPALVRRQHRRAVTHPGAVALVRERHAAGGRTEIAGFLVGTRRGVVDLLVTDDGPAPEDTARALLAVFHRRCADHALRGRVRRDGRAGAAA